MDSKDLAPIFIFSPATLEKRMKYIASFAQGFIYCVARKGITGAKTTFSDDLHQYLARCRKATSLPLAVGFGVKEKTDIEFLKGKADIAVIGTQSIRIMEDRGISDVGDFMKKMTETLDQWKIARREKPVIKTNVPIASQEIS